MMIYDDNEDDGIDDEEFLVAFENPTTHGKDIPRKPPSTAPQFSLSSHHASKPPCCSDLGFNKDALTPSCDYV